MNGRLGELAVWTWPAVVVLGGIVLGLLVQRALIPRIARLAARTAWHLDDLVIAAIRWPVVLWIALGGVRIAIRMLPLSAATDALLGTIVLVITIASVTWAAAHLAAGAVHTGVLHGGLTGASLLASIARIVVAIVGLLVILQSLGIHVTGIIAALGVGGLAVGLALQDTLANLFAGIRIVAGRKIRPGDFIRLDTGQDGTVIDIGWGQTTIRQGLNNIVIVPNSKLAQAVTINYSLPAPEQLFVVTLVAAHGSDLGTVERAAADAARTAMRSLPQGSPDFEPTILFQPFTDAGVPFITVLKARAFPDQGPVTSLFVKTLEARFRSERIAFGVPSRRVTLEGTPPPPQAPA